MKLGLTGSIGSGKTTVLEFLKQKGAEVFNSDREVKLIYSHPGPKLLGKLAEIFPQAKKGEKITASVLAKKVFDDLNKLKQLEEIIHPIVIAKLNSWLASAAKNKVYVAEVPLLFEKNLENLFDKTILIKADEKKINKRLLKRLNESEIKKRLALFLPEEKKAKKADFIVINDENLSNLKKEVDLLWQKINKI